MFRLRPVRRLFGLLLLALAGVSGLLALSLVQFVRLTDDKPVAKVMVRQQGDGQFQLATRTPDQRMRDYTLYGDQWQIDAKVVRWRLPALLAGVPPLYRLERLSGRYQDTARERSAPRSVHALDDWPAPDLAQVKRLVPNWLPFVDVQFGSAAYMPMFDGARYQVYLDPRGALFIRPADAVTAERLKQLGW
ncbi:membrane protein [Bordetella pertussis]|nr:membrane protein [Bordetella pertussis]CFL79633.1 membrane protein [Bordetella pertussis]CFN47584.1 membrane protein [Bordetella pertussis]CFN96363.1 membrane protein [Bordetella pertussis]CFO26876.1 membrane protein [Bordetella pertussis]